MKKFITYTAGTVAGVVALTYSFGYQYLFKGIAKTYLRGQTSATIDDYALFPSHPIVATHPRPWVKDANYNKKPLPQSILDDAKETKTAAFVIIKDGKLLHEQYFNGYNATSKTNSFSMAKTVTALLLGAAIDDGKIKSENQLFSDFYHNYAKVPFGKTLSLKDLVTMEAGLDWNENYHNPFSPNAKAYYGNSLAEAVFLRKLKETPGTHFEYQSGATQLLGFAIRKAVNMPLAEYASKKLWQPLGMEHTALWTTDENGMEKTFCCIYSNALDFAKLGQLLLDDGKVGSTQIIKPAYLKKMLTPTTLSDNTYGYGVWFNYDNKYKYYQYWGMLGQYIIVVPEKKLVIVRLGNNQDDTKDEKERATRPAIFVNEIIANYGF